ncbi:TPA: hypothetical protein TT917_000951 [Streptococcus equi subsp. zooepidemicus]|nr:hypothetical protein [Streptococcus equi subsp. zooepidemicus]HEL0042114.1 hypothetical protein [Streptococcus equi subsp. zooepidemicus]HEL0044192.1 hypothetical protein [Streptococcus equi subsp. zooepidemicus]HEL0052112.1 hypothetical protein [Streptococcus equi subsp. zooepidemicus]HEL0056313.1 hypothetical protein [Streptococcus equi subsp. zooepidemicus]
MHYKILQLGGIELPIRIESMLGAFGCKLFQLLIAQTPMTARVSSPSIVYTSLKKETPQRREALNGDFSDYHYFLWERSVGIYVCYQKQMGSLEERIAACLFYYDCQVETLDFIHS